MINLISLGAGVQSSTMALMAAHGEITPMPDGAIFADTQAEPGSVYRWLDWLEQQLPYPVHRVTKGDMTRDMLTLRNRQKPTELDQGLKRTWAASLIPAFVKNADGSKGIMGRQCTQDYKIIEIYKKARTLAGITRGQKTIGVIQWIGISLDEAHRMKPSRHPWAQNRWPLIDLRMTRQDCLNWMTTHGYPAPPRSACIYCPFHSNKEWQRLKTDEPAEFANAVQFEKDLQEIKRQTDRRGGVPFLHASLEPLSEVIFDAPAHFGQADLFGNECEGICGV